MTKPKPRPAPSPTALLKQAADDLRAQLEALNADIAERAEQLEAKLRERAQAEHELACAERALEPAVPAGARLLPPDRPAEPAPVSRMVPSPPADDAAVWEAQAEQLFGPLPDAERDPVFDD